MKKALISIIFATSIFGGCNRQLLDLDYSFNRAYIEGIGEVEVKTWCDYENSDMIQVTDKNGNVYLTHSSNVVLMKK